MPIYERAVDRGARRGRYLESRTANELLIARRAAGISQRELGRQIRVSHNKIRRVERGEPGQLTIDLAAKLGAVLGFQFSASLHPDGDPIRDAAHVALLQRFRARLPGGVTLRTEVPVPIEGDRRSADGIVEGGTFAALVEAETRIDDAQALERKVRSKQRDMGISRVILVVADTRQNRSVLRAVPGLREAFPLSTRACMAALARGRDPGGDALVFI